MKHIIPLLLICLLWQACTSKTKDKVTSSQTAQSTSDTAPHTAIKKIPVADAATILARKEVPVLCYHHIRDWRPNEKASIKDLAVPIANFKAQIKILADSGYHTISPDQLYAYLNTGATLPSKPILITFDDTDEEQYTIGATELEKYGFRGTYFIMTISIGRPRYMSKEQLKELSDNGHTIAAHTWDHHNVKDYGAADWDIQFKNPKEKLEAIVGKPVEYFAYPFGVWKEEAFPELRKRGYKAAFQLSTKIDPNDPLFTLRRMIVPGTWSPEGMLKWMKGTFNKHT